MSNIELTKDYEKFKVLNGNRPVDSGHVRKLAKAIEERDYTSSNPIKVDKDFNIIDGQHRFTACKNLGLPIYYIQKDFEAEDFIHLNRNTKAVTIEDYLNFRAKNGDPEFQCLMRISEITGMPPQWVFTFHKGSCGLVKIEQDLKIKEDAQEIVDNIEVMKEIIATIEDTPIENCKYIHTLKFCRALYRFIRRTEGFEKDRLIRNIRIKYSWLVNYGAHRLYTDCLKKIYNYRRKNT